MWMCMHVCVWQAPCLSLGLRARVVCIHRVESLSLSLTHSIPIRPSTCSNDETRLQLALAFFKDKARRVHLSTAQLAQLLPSATSLETKKALLLLLAPYLSADATADYRPIVELFHDPRDVRSPNTRHILNLPLTHPPTTPHHATARRDHQPPDGHPAHHHVLHPPRRQ